MIFITGGLGGLGRHISKLLFDSGFDIKILAYKNKKYARWFPKSSIIWGDISRIDTYRHVLPVCDAIIHTAFIVNPDAHYHPQAHEINVGGTKTLIKALEHVNPLCKLIFTSSVSVYDSMYTTEELITVDHSIKPVDVYAKHKAECETLIRESTLKKWFIFRITLTPYLEVNMNTGKIKGMFNYPWNYKVEFIHVKDVALACLYTLSLDSYKEIFNIGGGSQCQLIYYDILKSIFTSMYLPVPPKEKFHNEQQTYGGWYNTARSQKLLKYQRYRLEDYISDLKHNLGKKAVLLKRIKPLSSLYMNSIYKKL